ncbi:MAG TPA: hypothetical protein VM901_10085 [Bdellovibrionota bacterium]|jgi:hypothetical protein|nr:hypothetical protein [Bdellovibrionota bacterium]
MKTLVKTLTLFFVLGSVSTVRAETKSKIFWIEDDSEFDLSEKSSNRELKRRVRQLERAVAQLQRRVFELEYKDGKSPLPSPTPEKAKKFTCYIETPFEGLVSETRESRTEAQAAVVKTCGEKTSNSLNCKIANAKCGE